MAKTKYFTTRNWGFGSNIVNFLKSSFYCGQNNCRLILNDTNNTISTDFSLFSVIHSNDFLTRSAVKKIIPIENFKSFVKYNLNSKYTIKEKLHSLAFLFKIRKEYFLNNFSTDAEINNFFKINFQEEIGKAILKHWNYTDETLTIFDKLSKKHDLEGFVPDLAIQVRGGDKILEAQAEGTKMAHLEEYLAAGIREIEKINKEDVNIYIMTDTYSYYQFLKEKIAEHYPNATIKTLVSPSQEGYLQGNFNKLDESEKIKEYYLFLFELEYLRKSISCIGSFNSNIFYLAYILSRKNSTYISVDTNLDDIFL